MALAVALLLPPFDAAPARGDPPATPQAAPAASPRAPAAANASGTVAPAAPIAASTAERTSEVKPEVYYVRDKEGRLVPVPGFSYEDFVRYYRLKEKLDRPEPAPRFGLEQMTLTGESRGDRVELTAVFKLLLNDADWVRVPLRLNQCVLRGTAEFKGAGEEFLQFDPVADGYVCWIRSAAHSECELTLHLLAPVANSAEESRLELNAPHAAVSQLTLHVSAAGAIADASPGLAPPEVMPAHPPAAGSDISVLGVGGDCWLSWRGPDQPLAQLSSALEVTGAVLMRIDGRSVNSDATLTVRSFGAEFDRLHIRLPRGAELIGGRQDGYTLTAGNGADAGLVEVKLDRKTAGPIDIRLSTERAYDVTKPGESLELAGFAVAEAIPHRQWGYLAVAVAGDWQLVWGEENRVRRVSELPDSLRRKDLVAGFEYYGQPNSLSVRVMPRKTRISVEPQYVYSVREDEVRLDARLDYTIRGAKPFQLEVDLPGWEIDKIRPEGVIDSGAISTSASGTITLPLAEPATGDIELNLTAHRRNGPSLKSIAWTLPQPRVDVVGPAEVAILPADNIELTPRPAQISGLGRSNGRAFTLRSGAIGALPPNASPFAGSAQAADAAAGPLSKTGPDGGPILGNAGNSNAADFAATALFYRAEQADAKFAADFAVRQQDVSVELDNQVSIRDRDVSVVQAIDYLVRYVPLERLRLDVPRALLEQRRLRFAVGKETLQPQATPSETDPARTAVSISLPRPILGAFRLEISFTMPEPRPAGSASAPLDLPLSVPRDGSIVANTAAITAQPGVRIDQREGAWNPLETPAASAGADQTLRLAASDPTDELRLAISRDDSRLQSATFVDRAWIQTWLTESVRQDRIAYWFSTNEDQLRLELPVGIGAADVELTLDGQPLTPSATPSGPLVIALPPESERREHVLELRYQFADRGPHDGSLVLEAPKWENHVTIRRTYWQLLLPADEHLLKAAGDLTPEYDWMWNSADFGLRRVPLKDDAQLEQWVGLTRVGKAADPSAAGPARVAEIDEQPGRVNRYLFSTAGQGGRFQVVIVRQWLLLLIASAVVLAIGLALIYFPRLRAMRTLVAAAAVAIVAAIVFPDPALLLAQAGSLGLLLIAAALLLRRLTSRQPAAVKANSISHHTRLERSSTRLHAPREQELEPATTATSPPVVEMPSRSRL